jgi:ABC-type proline/glycine betaine transport system substrate-binding protein
MSLLRNNIKKRLRRLLVVGLVIVLLPAVGHPAPPTAPANPDRTAAIRPATAVETIRLARATWDTGWFQAEIFKTLFEQLG